MTRRCAARADGGWAHRLARTLLSERSISLEVDSKSTTDGSIEPAFVRRVRRQGSGFLLPGDISYGTSFASLGTKPIEAWAAIPDLGKIQILVSIGLMEFHSEMAGDIKVHYTKGGPMPGNTNDRWCVLLAAHARPPPCAVS